MVLILPLISSSHSLFSRPLGTITRAPTTISFTFTFLFHIFFSALFSLSLSLWDPLERQNLQDDNFFFSHWLTLSLVIWPRLDDLFVLQNPWEFYPSHPLRRILVCRYTIFIRLKFYYYFTPCKFFTPTSAHGLSRESEWQQVSSGVCHLFEYFSRSLKRRWSGFFFWFLVFLVFFQAFRDRSQHLDDSRSLQITRILLRIPANLNYALV